MTIRDVEMDCATAGLARAEGRDRLAKSRKTAAAGPIVLGRLVADERTALVVVVRRQQHVERDLRVAVEGVAIGERQLRALGDDVHELGFGELGEVEALEQRELLQPDRAGRPWLRLAHGESSVLVCGGRLESRLPRRHVGTREQAALVDAEAVDLVRRRSPGRTQAGRARSLPLASRRGSPRRFAGRWQRGLGSERALRLRGRADTRRWIRATREGAPR